MMATGHRLAVVIPLDGSVTSAGAFAAARALTRLIDGVLHVVHVTDQPMPHHRLARHLQITPTEGDFVFHQVHGGVATNAPRGQHPFPSFHAEYQAIRGEPFAPPVREPILLGGMPRQAVPFLTHSIAALGSA